MRSAVQAVSADVPFTGSPAVWYESPALRALESLMAAAVEQATNGGSAFLFVWDSAQGRMVPVSQGRPDVAIRSDTVRRYLTDTSLPSSVKSGESLLLPIPGSSGTESGLEGLLLVSFPETPDESTIEELRDLCCRNALLLAGIRRGEQLPMTLGDALHDLGTPLVSARGYTRLALAENGAWSPPQREYLSKVLENLERMVETVRTLRLVGAQE